MSYLDRFKGYQGKDKRPKQSIKYDRWDLHTAEQIRREVRDYLIAEQDLGKKVTTGIEAMSDTLFALYKARPELIQGNEIRPSHRVNHAVMNELMGLSEFDKNRAISVGDPIGTGLACAAMEPELEILFDKLSEAQKIADKLDSLVDQYENLQADADDLLDQIQSTEDEDEKADFQSNLDAINEGLKALANQIEKGEEELQTEIDNQQPALNNHLKSAMEKVSDNVESLNQVESWGLQPGGVRKMSPEARLKLAKKLQTDKFKKMADIFGKMQTLAFHEQTHKVDYSSEEIYDLEQGADLHRVVPVELLALNDEILVYEWLHRFVERSLIQYSLRGEDNVMKGGILILEDGSSSMSGTKEIWAKAIGLALLKIATIQKRPFHAINFAGPGMFVRWDFDTSGSTIKSIKTHRNSSREFEGLEAVFDYAETAMNGGTNFETPFSVALDILQDQHNVSGSVNGDIVFLTDGECGMSETFIKDFKGEQTRLGFEVFGIAIQTNPNSEPFHTMCDGKCIGLKQLTDVNDLKPLFQRL